MIKSFSVKYSKHIAYPMFFMFYMQVIIAPLHAALHVNSGPLYYTSGKVNYLKPVKSNPFAQGASIQAALLPAGSNAAKQTVVSLVNVNAAAPAKLNIGGPSSPEASSFKTVGSDNLVNLFSGDFSYSVPLLDVGGYPVNLFYNGGISPEQEASWVGLGWNINPGSVTRGLRGVPDDFNGTDTLIQRQNVKPNRTWGGEVGIDGEALGFKQPKVNLSLGISYNNYLGPAMDLGAGISINIPIGESVKSEKSAPADSAAAGSGIGASLNAKLSSRSGLTLSPSLNANLALGDKKSSIGVGLSTSYNSRTGIRDLNLNLSTSIHVFSKNDTKEFHSENNKGSLGGSMNSNMGNTISFSRPSYMPTMRMPMQYGNYSGQLELGLGFFGLRGSGHAQGYYSESKVPVESRILRKQLVGYIYAENAAGNPNAVMDFNRINDGEVTPRTPIISAPQYSYDVFTIQGEGTGGMIRAYRGDLGFMKDNETTSKDENISIGADIAPGGHFGLNWNVVKTPTRAGAWQDGNNTLQYSMKFGGKTDNSDFENVYFRNPGEMTVSNTQLINRIGGDNIVRFKLGGSNANTRLESSMELFSKNTLSATGIKGIDNGPVARDKRAQVTTMLTAAQASVIGLDKNIRNYNDTLSGTNNLTYTQASRVDRFRKAHHISEIDVLEQTGMRYVYGLPVYNTIQKEYTFSVDNVGNPSTGIVLFGSDETDINSSHHMNNSSKTDGYVMSQETPAYATSFLLSGLLSPDYVDVTGDGITEDDLGTAVKFDYSKSADPHKWRTPRNNSAANTAHFNAGIKSEKKDNKGVISYGEREVWYLHAIESKSMVAVFKTDNRSDAKGVNGEFDGTANSTENANKKLTRIDLYTKAEIKAKGITNARPVKTVHFAYSYTLCSGTPDNAGGGGKLTLDSIYFTFNGQSRGKKSLYVFNYGNTASSVDNPSYSAQSADRWGTYKNASANPGSLSNEDYPYTNTAKATADQYAAAWSLKKVLLPSGGQMEMQYEADDYAYVQDRRAADMFNIYGLGKTTAYTTDNGLYSNGLSALDNYFVYIQLPQPLTSTTGPAQKQEILEKYLQGVNQPAFKLMVNMPKGEEPLTVYPYFDDYGLCSNSGSKDIIYIKLRPLDGESPLARSAIGFITESLPGQAFPGYDVEVTGIKAFLEMAGAMLTNLKNAFKDVNKQMRTASPPMARTIVLSKSFVRLDDPDKIKIGGGIRVKRVLVKDNWNRMTNQFNSVYGQDYDYTTTEKINGQDAVISSGVASYEPGIGSEENPFREIVTVQNKMPLASAQYGAIEMPMLEGFFPSPSVGYSKVTVRSIHRKGTHGDSTLRSAIGKQVTEFYTAREFPSRAVYTPMSTMTYHHNTVLNIFYKEVTDRKVVSQGFMVETNDMHGKMKSQIAYAESDEKTPLSYSYHYYKNTGKNGLNDQVDFTNNKTGGTISKGIMGVDMELMTDVREFRVQTSGVNGQLQADFFTYVPFPIFALPSLFLKTYTENDYKAVTATKLINYHAIEDSVVVMDKGSVVSTSTIVYDAETGSPIVTKTRNEFNDPIYNTTYPAYWAYSGMGPAYKNINTIYKNVNFRNGKITSAGIPDTAFESGDEILILSQSGTPSDSCTSVLNLADAPLNRLWVFDTHKDTNALANATPHFYFMDRDGKLFSKTGVRIQIIRSGRRNMLGQTAATVTSMAIPIVSGKLKTDINSKVVNASAIEFDEKRKADPDVFKRFEIPQVNKIVNGDFEQGNTAFTTSYPGTNYNVGTSTVSWNGSLADCHDFTSGSGNMLMLNENGQSAVNGWVSQTISVSPSTTYKFSGWFDNIQLPGYATTDTPQVQIKINGVALGGSFKILGSCNWQEQVGFWSSGAATTAVISILDPRTSGYGGYIGIDNLYFGESICTAQESCNGSLDSTVNPYVKGLLGNFRNNVAKVFYGSREESSTAVQTKIRTNGYLKNFSPYWDFNVSNNLVPDLSNANWVWTVRSTKYNNKGMELETKDALNIYTSAQYTFNKTVPSAVVQNARSGESFYEGFEGNNYSERINAGADANCTEKKYVDFNNLSESVIDTVNNAHSGIGVLKVNANKTAVKEFKVLMTDTSDFSLAFPLNTNSGYIHPGQLMTNYTATCSDGYLALYDLLGDTTFIRDQLVESAMFEMNGSHGNTCTESGTFKSYVIANITGTYSTLIKSFHEEFFFKKLAEEGVCTYGDISVTPDTIYVRVYDNANNLVGSFNDIASIITYQSQNSSLFNWTKKFSSSTDHIYLTAGIYRIEIDYGHSYSDITATENCEMWVANNTQFSLLPPRPCPSSPANRLTMYYDLDRDTTCSHESPIQGQESMLNPKFTLQPGKHMLFSGWVHEACSTPCTKKNFTDGTVRIKFNTGEQYDFAAKGAIIEGWQKIEQDFVVPAGAVSAKLSFINNSGSVAYFDDIRIHPFNANMKSSVYDPFNLRLTAQQDENNYSTSYEYDEEGQLVRVKKETAQGIKTINETRSAKQQAINTIQ